MKRKFMHGVRTAVASLCLAFARETVKADAYDVSLKTLCDGVETTVGTITSDGLSVSSVMPPESPKSGFAFAYWQGDVVVEDARFAMPLKVRITESGTLTAVYLPVRYVKPESKGGDDTADGLTWGTALATIQTAHDAFGEAPGVIYLGEGVFAGPQPLLNMTSPVIVVGQGAGKTFLTPDNATSAATAVINAADGVLRRVSVTGNTRAYAVEFGSKGGLLCESVVATNTAGGVSFPVNAKGIVSRCEIVDNSLASGNGTAINKASTGWGVTIRNCLLAHNTAADRGAAVYAANAINIYYCTIVDNYAPNGGALMCKNLANGSLSVVNCIVDNRAQEGLLTPNFYNEKRTPEEAFVVKNSFTYEQLGTDPVVGELNFVSAAEGNYRLRLGSVCRDAGAAIATKEVSDQALDWQDLDGNPRRGDGAADIGCYEYQHAEKTVCDFRISPPEIAVGDEVWLTGFVAGSGTYDCYWQIFDSSGAEVLKTSGESVSVSVTGAYGAAKVLLSVTNRADSADSATYALEKALMLCPATTYVVPADVKGAGDGVSPYDTWAKATTNISMAMEAVVHGGTVLLSNGTHKVYRQLKVFKNLTLRGFGGRDATFVRQALEGPLKGDRILLLQNKDAVIRDLTFVGARVKNDYCETPNKNYSLNGAGVSISGAGGLVQDCRITDCSPAEKNGQGAVSCDSEYGRITRCVIDDNDYFRNFSSPMNSGSAGVLISAGQIDNCLVRGNYGAGPSGIVLSGAARVLNCTVVDNKSKNNSSGGLSIGKMTAAGLLQNTIAVGNVGQGGQSAAVGYPEWMLNGVTAASDLAVISNATITCTFGKDFAWPLGATYVNAGPSFVDADNGDYTLQGSSKLINAGTVYDGADQDTDLRGLARTSGSGIDLGCYEFDFSQRSVSAVFGPLVALAGDGVAFEATVAGGDSEAVYACYWTILSAGTEDVVATGTGSPFVVRTLVPGKYEASLLVSELPDGAIVYSNKLDGILQVGARTNFVVSAEGYVGVGGEWPYDTWQKATTNVNLAVGAAVAGATICLGAGEHKALEIVSLTNALTLCGSGWRKTTLRYASKGQTRLLSVNHPLARVEDMTLTGGDHRTDATFGSSVEVGYEGGTLVRCRFTGNRVRHGVSGAVALNGSTAMGAHGRISECLFDDTDFATYEYKMTGCALYVGGGIVENCVFVNNVGTFCGGIRLAGSDCSYAIRNCTFVNNRATVEGCGGAFSFEKNCQGSLENLLFSGNTNSFDGVYRDVAVKAAEGGANPPMSAAASFANCLFDSRAVDNPIGTGSFSGTAVFRAIRSDVALSNWRQKGDSAGFKTGRYDATWMQGTVDFYGEPRARRLRATSDWCVDIGACEADWPHGLMILCR